DAPLIIPAQSGGISTTTVITYTYDPLYRLTDANYNDSASYFHYTYDAVGNRMTKSECLTGPICPANSTAYPYDAANRLVNVGGVAYTWENNGNLLSDGASTYAYDSANRLTSVTQGVNTYTFAYNGLSDRLRQTVNGAPTNYTLDLNAGLTQVLADGTNTYLYGNGRIAQQSTTGTDYFLGDALGSVRQLADASGAVTLAKSYQPYGSVMSSAGSGTSIYGWTGEQADSYIKLLYLRARWYSGDTGRFTTRDVWPSDYTRPQSLNGFAYVEANPINRVDPSGHWWWGPGQALFDASEMRSQSQNIHVRIQAIMMVGRMEEVHAEYVIPGSGLPVDLLDSVTGEMWEIKPWDERGEAWATLSARLTAMEAARAAGLLKGMTPVATTYDWNLAPIEWIPGRRFPTHNVYIGTDDSGQYDIYATQTEAGVIAWWKYKRPRREQVPYPIVLPERVTYSQRNIRQGWKPALAPAVAGSELTLPGLDLPQQGLGTLCPRPATSGIAIDTQTGAIIVGGTITIGTIWWLGKLLAPLCGPAAPVCAIGF
ncbi:MAG: RHS repeat-associated core domain-containing protein, partial [Chloroflexi bacterium]|nr:RHS repeat-associated core domain-containing protein [Chloroflexota bacterium]